MNTNARQKKETPKKRKKSSLIPQQMIQNESLELVASPIIGPIRTRPLSILDKEIILDRFKKEIVDKFGFTLSPAAVNGHVSSKRRRIIKSTSSSSSTSSLTLTVHDPRHDPRHDAEGKKLIMARIAKSRIVVGTNSCTRAMETLISSQSQQLKHDDSNSNNNKDNSPSPVTVTVTTVVSNRPLLCILARDIRPPSIMAHIPYLCHLMKVPILLLPGKASHELGSILGGKKVSVMLFTESSSSDGDDADERCHKLMDSFITFAKGKLPS